LAEINSGNERRRAERRVKVTGSSIDDGSVPVGDVGSRIRNDYIAGNNITRRVGASIRVAAAARRVVTNASREESERC
jgi:hypothetical protein